MRHRNFLPIVLLALALAPVAVQADPDPGALAFARLAADDEDKKDKDKKDKGHKWKDDDRNRGRDRGDDDWDGRGAQGVPPGHLPPPGECRVWYDGEPPGQQPPPTDCATARREASRNGGRVIYGDGRRDDRWNGDDDRWDDDWGNRREGERWLSRFDSFDRNDDGYLSRSEWTADPRVFDFIDVNDDRRLSRNEVRDAWNRSRDQRGDRSQRRGVRLEDRFRDNDDNRDGRLSLNEWWGRDEAFDRLDLNNDSYLSWAEVAGRGGRGR